MHFPFLDSLLNILLVLILFFTKSSFVKADEIQVPEPLTTNNYKKELSKGLHIVDFYSPYCSHCKALEPIWNDAYREFYEESQKLNIHFSKVNCIESGDICDMEQITFFPNIRLYGPSGFIKNYPNEAKRSKESLIQFARESAANKDNFKKTKVKSSSKNISGKELEGLIENMNSKEEGILVSFWPSKNMNKSDQETVFEGCESCLTFQRTWSAVSKFAPNKNVEVYHVNCEAYKSFCAKYGFKHLTERSFSEKDPGVAFILPNNHMKRFWKYCKPLSFEPSTYIDWATRLISNSKVPEISIEDILKKENTNVITSLLSNNLETFNTRVTYVKDRNNLALSKESMESISSLDVELLQTNYEFLDNIEEIFAPVEKMINYNETEGLKKFDRNYINLIKNINLPAYMIWKEGNFIPAIVSADIACSESCLLDLLLKKLDQLRYSTYSKLPKTTKEMKKLFSNRHNRYVVLQVIDNNEENESIKFLGNLSVAACDYFYTYSNYIVDQLMLTDNHIKSLFEKMSTKIELSINEKNDLKSSFDKIEKQDIDFMFVDIKEDLTFKDRLKLPERPEGYIDGDIIIIDKKRRIFYTKNALGNNLNSLSKYDLKESLLTLTLPSYSHSKIALDSRMPLNAFHPVICIVGVFLLFFLYKFRRSITKIHLGKKKQEGIILGNFKGTLKD
ncbi:hypothetical protein TPHA_0I02340 [Tetrapisispora phaffii CBS 4417]|uniref:Thioredoxin domain-containing protein n=1 Tax=Tetrapisispora phaffii (strain ATCC 24235 / CBS 4417 / NBRC 1672 / NRRL Y-8282 / UCD 70-5) TaxID=1071381 RepID=G8BXV9_TETPH|nr:hypothetical protein TPHA_0I02340 [Tetrapisispora phaffii CBS 4417]CCE64737.1 hypothetical protein TPHA_0I02340 [Tetrapisispora phaffii CBS 4417]